MPFTLRSAVVACAVALLLLTVVLPATPVAADGENDPRPVRSVDSWWVGEDEVVEDVILLVKSNVTVARGATLILRNVELVFEGTGLNTAISSQPGSNRTPAGAIHLISTERGPTHLRHADPATGGYFFASWGEFKALGRPDAPVVIEHVRGSSGGAGPEQTSGLFINGLQLIGPSNEIDHLIFQDSRAGIGISSVGETRISNATIRRAGFPLYLQMAEDVLVTNSELHGERAAVYANQAKNITIRSSVLSGRDYGILAHQSEMTFSNDTISAAYMGALGYNGGEYGFSGNRFSGYSKAAIGLARSFEPRTWSSSLFAEGNTMSGAGAGVAGVFAEFADRVVLRNNTIREHVESGAYIGFATAVEVTDNVLERNGRYGAEVSLAPFTESGNRFGVEPDDWNGIAGFHGNSTAKFIVHDLAGSSVENASILIAGEPEGIPQRAVSNGDGRAQAVVPFLSISNEGQRILHAYEVTASKEGNGTTTLRVIPYEAREQILTLGSPSSDPADAFALQSIRDGAPSVMLGVALVGLLALLALRRFRGSE